MLLLGLASFLRQGWSIQPHLLLQCSLVCLCFCVGLTILNRNEVPHISQRRSTGYGSNHSWGGSNIPSDQQEESVSNGLHLARFAVRRRAADVNAARLQSRKAISQSQHVLVQCVGGIRPNQVCPNLYGTGVTQQQEKAGWTSGLLQPGPPDATGKWQLTEALMMSCIVLT